MINRLKELIKDKKVLVLGFGKEGSSTYNVLENIRGFKCLDVADLKEIRPNITSDSKYYCGIDYQKNIEQYDVIFKSPGVELEKNIEEYSCTITSQIEEFIKEYRMQIIGITGTKGKSTTASLLYHVLKENNKDVLLGGNIGLPVFELIENINEKTMIVTELSSYQLETLKISPHTAIFLNLYEDHLQRHHTIKNYFNCKANIYKHQTKGDKLFVGEKISSKIDCDKYIITNEDIPKIIKENYNNIKLHGPNNLLNIAFVNKITKMYGISEEALYEALITYQPLSHRLEFIDTVNGVSYYDDSISTTAESAINAITSIPNTKTIFLGGVDRGIDYTILTDYILTSELDNILLMYASGEKIYKILLKENCQKNCILFANLDEATKWALENCQPKTAAILSPAAASHGYFLNFEERGKHFQNLIKNHK